MKNFLVNASILLASLLTSLVLLEGILAVWNPFDYRIKGNLIVLPINRVYKIRLEGRQNLDAIVHHTKNSLGFRGPALQARTNGTLAVLAVGGSTTENFYSSDGEDWPSLLSERLSRVFQNVWINNAGLDGHSTFGHRVLVEEIIIPLRPDVIFFLVGYNDVERGDPGKSDRRNLRVASGIETFRDFVILLANNSEVAGLVLNAYRSYVAWRMGLGHRATTFVLESQEPAPPVAEKWAARVLAEHARTWVPGYRARLEALVEITRQAGILPVLVTQPSVLGPAVDSGTGLDLGAISGRYGNGLLTWRVIELYNQVTRDTARAAGVPLVDLGGEFPKETTFFYDSIHFTRAGNRKVAELVFEGVCKSLVARFSDKVVGRCR